MSDKTPLFLYASGAVTALLAGVMQVSVVSVLALRMRPMQFLGSFFISAIFGGGVTVSLQNYWQWDPFIAGVMGSFTGAVPAVLIPLLVTRMLMKRLGIDNADLTNLFKVIRPEEAPPSGPDKPE